MNMQPIAFLQNLSSWEIILIFLVVLLFFGAKRLPGLAKSFGKSMREFKKATSDIEEDIRTAMDEDPEPSKPTKKASTPATTEPKAIEPDDSDDAAEVTEAADQEKEPTKA
jgi:sec-independent protein translocase protein TatA